MDSSISTRSPNVYGNGGPEAIAEATADLRKSMAAQREHRIQGVGGGGSFAWSKSRRRREYIDRTVVHTRGRTKAQKLSSVGRQHVSRKL